MEVSPARREPSAARRWHRLRTLRGRFLAPAGPQRRRRRCAFGASLWVRRSECIHANTIKSLPPGKHVPHWRSSNNVLRNRVSLTVYLGSDLERKWSQPLARGERGRPLVYRSAVITLRVGVPVGVSAGAAGGRGFAPLGPRPYSTYHAARAGPVPRSAAGGQRRRCPPGPSPAAASWLIPPGCKSAVPAPS